MAVTAKRAVDYLDNMIRMAEDLDSRVIEVPLTVARQIKELLQNQEEDYEADVN